jgi:hypothetical protein
MAKTYTEQALTLATRQQAVAARDGSPASTRGIKFLPGGRVYMDSTRISFEAAVQHIAARLEAEAAPAPSPMVKGEPRRTGFSWDCLNQATQDFFYNICEQMQTVSQDHGMTMPVAVKELQIGLKHAPRLSNLKKAGLIEGFAGLKKSHKMLRLTEAGRAIWQAYA